MACLLLSVSAARAGTYSAPTFSGGKTVNDGGPPVSYGSQGGTDWGNNYSGASYSITCSGDIKTTYTWQPAPNKTLTTDPPPQYVIVQEECDVNPRCTCAPDASGHVTPATGSCNNGLGVSQPSLTATPLNDGTGDIRYQAFANSVRYRAKAAGSSVALSCSASLTISGPAQCSPEGTVHYSPSIYPITISLPGTTPDSSGNLHILVGQRCSATLNGIPSGLTVTNIQWSASGKYVQPNSWNISTDNSKATFGGLDSTYTYTQSSSSAPAPFWYWDDVAGVQTVNCTATVTPPSGQGPAFTVTATQKVSLEVPAVQNTEYVGQVQISTKIPGTGSQLALGAGPATGTGLNSYAGIYFGDSVTIPATPYSSKGTWYHLQLVSVKRYRTPKGSTTATGAQGNSVMGALDAGPNGGYVYGGTFAADGTTGSPTGPTYPDTDSPWTGPLSDSFGEYAITNETFTTYIMYRAPGASIDVPLTYYTWSWNVDVNIPTTPLPMSWSNWNNRATGGTITGPGTAQRTLLYPEWSSFGNISWQQ